MTCLNRDHDPLDEIEDQLDALEDNLAGSAEGSGSWNPYGYMPGWWIPCETINNNFFNVETVTLSMNAPDSIWFCAMYLGWGITIDKLAFECNGGCSGTVAIAFYIEAGGLPYKPQHTRGPISFSNPAPSGEWDMVEVNLDPVIELDEAIYWVATKWTGNGSLPARESQYNHPLLGSPAGPLRDDNMSALFIPAWTTSLFPDPVAQDIKHFSGAEAPTNLLHGATLTPTLAVRIQPEPEE